MEEYSLTGDVKDNDDSPIEVQCRNCKHIFISGAKRKKCPKCKKTSMLKEYERH